MFLSPSTVSVSIAITGVASNVVADVSASSPNCTTSGNGRTCTIALSAPTGTDTFTATLYDAANATGDVLGVGTATQTVTAGQPFSVAIGVAGSPVSLAVVATPTVFTAGVAANATVTVSALDAGNNVIAGTYAVPITLTNSDTSGAFTLSTNQVTASTQAVTLHYNGGAGIVQATLGATATGVLPANVQQQVVHVTGGPASGIYVANASSNTITVYPVGSSGNVAPIRTLAGAATGIDTPIQAGFDSLGDLLVTERVGGYISVFAPGATGNTAPIRVLTTPGGPSPSGIAIGAADDVFVSNCPNCNAGGGQPEIFHFPASATTPDREIIGAMTGLTVPGSLAVDPTGTVTALNAFGGSIDSFAPSASGNVAPLRSVTVNGTSNMQFITYDAGSFFVTDANGVFVFPTTANGATTASTVFTNGQLGIAFPSAIAINMTTASPTLVIGDYSGNGVVTVTTTGTPPTLGLGTVTRISGAATGINGPTAVLVVP